MQYNKQLWWTQYCVRETTAQNSILTCLYRWKVSSSNVCVWQSILCIHMSKCLCMWRTVSINFLLSIRISRDKFLYVSSILLTAIHKVASLFWNIQKLQKDDFKKMQLKRGNPGNWRAKPSWWAGMWGGTTMGLSLVSTTAINTEQCKHNTLATS